MASWPIILMPAIVSMSGMRGAEIDGRALAQEKLPAGTEPPGELARWQKSLNPDGAWSVLKVIPASPSETHALPLPSGRVRWARVFPAAWHPTIGNVLQIIGDPAQEPPAVEEVSTLREPPPLLPFPTGVNAAGHMGWTPFGAEERVSSENPDAEVSTWIVKEGRAPAGIYSAKPWRLPKSTDATRWSLEIELRGRGAVQIGVSGMAREDFSDPVMLGTIDLKGNDAVQKAAWVMPEKIAAMKQVRLTLLPMGTAAGEFRVEDVTWRTKSHAISDAGAKQDGIVLGVWDWSTQPAQWQRLQPLWKKAGVTALQLALPRGLDEAHDSVASHLASLRADGFEIIAVEGDPHMILPQAREAVLSRHQTLLKWRARLLNGIQYDVEPYLLPGFQLNPDRWHQRWLELYQTLAPSGEQFVEPVVPFWLLTQQAAGPFLRGVAGRSARLVVMNYRSNPVEAAAWATAWLEWSLQHECPVAIAIECGPVPDVKSATFRRGDKGTLWVAPWPGHGTAVALFDEDVTAASGESVFALSREATVSGSATSLKGRPHEEVAEQLRLLREVCQRMALPAALRPRLLLHEPEDGLLEFLGR
jgi:hypothetical protein